MTKRIVEVTRRENSKALRSEIKETILYHDRLIPKLGTGQVEGKT